LAIDRHARAHRHVARTVVGTDRLTACEKYRAKAYRVDPVPNAPGHRQPRLGRHRRGQGHLSQRHRGDLASARAAGMACVQVRGGYCDGPGDELGADLVTDDLAALPAALLVPAPPQRYTVLRRSTC
jgi:hypothetical protein